MKRIAMQYSRAIAVVMMLIASLSMSAQVAELEKYSDRKDVTYVYVSKFMLSMAAKLGQSEINGVKLNKLANKMHSIQVITTESESERKNLIDDVMSLVKRGKFELMMQASEDDDKMRMYFKENATKNGKSVVLMLTIDSTDCNVIAITGTFTSDDLMYIADCKN